jgi:hypothetical protein
MWGGVSVGLAVVAGGAVYWWVSRYVELGQPKPGAIHLEDITDGSGIAQLQADSEVLHELVDDFVGWGGLDRLRNGDSDLWQKFSEGATDGGDSTPLRDQMREDVQKFLQDLARTDVTKKQELETDAHNLQLLVELADKHHDSLGAQCMLYYHRVSEDIHYYLTGKGEEYSVSNTEGSREVNLFLKPYLDQLGH